MQEVCLSPVVQDLSIAIALFLVLVLALELGFRAGRQQGRQGEAGSGQVGAIQGAVLGLLGLLLAFSFAAAGSRFLERQDLVVEEANAIGTAYLRADLLDAPHAGELREALKRYTEQRLEVSRDMRTRLTPAALAEVDRLHARIWNAAIAGVAERPAAVLGVLPPVNDVIDLHSTRLAAGRKRLPALVMALLIASSLLSVAVMGYGCGIAGDRRAPLTIALAALIGTSLWITIDLDSPRAGLIQLSDAPLQSLPFLAPSAGDGPGPASR
jgi:hypothetical protein